MTGPGKRNVVKTPNYTVTATTDKRRLRTMKIALINNMLLIIFR